MTHEQLEYYANKFLMDKFNMPLGIPIRISKRMTSKLGAFRIKYIKGNRQKIDMEIIISYNFIVHNTEQFILDVLYHECVHYALFTKGQPYKDSDPEFKETLKRLGISQTRTHQFKGRRHLYECKKCRYQFSRNMKGYEKRYVCRKCRGRFSYLGEVK
ncbi:SprT-like domain-containing protein [Salinicoccus siamensis]|uniref:SprT-like domain-containing protein n=1 Tax=Salinicoccus siamensis TaxID=381830 RepID=A0ABV5Z5D8_9STAP